MAFRNQIQSVAVTSIKSVTDFVPQATRDDYFWPGVSGVGGWVPSLANMAYVILGAKSAVQGSGTTVGQQILATPAVSRTPYDATKKTFIVEWKARITSNPAPGWATTSGSYVDPQPWIGFGVANSTMSGPQSLNYGATTAPRGWALTWMTPAGTTSTEKALMFAVSDGNNAISAAQFVDTGIRASNVSAKTGPLILDRWGTFRVTTTETATILELDDVTLATIATGWPVSAQSDTRPTTGKLAVYWTQFSAINVGLTEIWAHYK